MSQNAVREKQQVVEPLFDHLDHQFDVEALILVNQHISESNHSFKPFRKVLWDKPIDRKQAKALFAFLRKPQLAHPHHMVCQIDTLLAGPLQIQRNGVLAQIVLRKRQVAWKSIIRPDLFDAPLDALGDVVHKS